MAVIQTISMVLTASLWIGLDAFYHETENLTTFRGRYEISGKPSAPSLFSSAGFPLHYIQDSAVYRYQILSDYGRIKLSFDDWSLAPTGQVIIYPSSSAVTVDRVVGTSLTNRPLVYSTYGDILIEFATGIPWSSFDVKNRPYFGFTARYEFFIDIDQRTNLPYTAGSAKYFYSQLGGSLVSACTRTTEYIDSLWVIPRTAYSTGYTQVSLRLDDTSICATAPIFGQSLNIRTGKTSQSAPLMVYVEEAKAGLRFTTVNGFYVRLQCQTQCARLNTFAAVFVWNIPAVVNETHPGGYCSKSTDFLCRRDQVCISRSLRCDGLNHCSLGEDEADCDQWLRIRTTTTPPPDYACEPLSYVNCADGHGMYCNKERCDGQRNCVDGSDESRCSSPTQFSPYPRSSFRKKKKVPTATLR